ncbi:MAG: Na+/H+ antiporter NhaA [Eggerthellaceae bacterium]|jgi:NhaA family Na+:H+ antiporter
MERNKQAEPESLGKERPQGQTASADSLFIDAAQRHERRYQRIISFTHSSTKAAGIMLVAAIAALVIANSPAAHPFEEFVHTQAGFFFGDAAASMSLGHVINDLLMSFFFLLVGLEIKYEMTAGELTSLRQALLPIIAAIGGVLMPIAIYLLLNGAVSETAGGWGVPTATDIAFALGIMALLGNRIPRGIRVFLSTLAVADDIIAVLLIALFYGDAPDFRYLLAAAVVLAALIAVNRSHVYGLVPYLLLGCVLWVLVYQSGIHATLAGVLLAFTIPSGSRVNLKTFIGWSDEKIRQADASFQPDEPLIGQKDYVHSIRQLSKVSRQVIPPATRLENALYPWVYFLILPLFALTNANVTISGDVGSIVSSPAFLGVFFGLLAGKPAGILLASFIVVKIRLARLPEQVTWGHMVGASVLGGIGFTMAIFVANLAFDDAGAMMAAKLAILAASLIAGVAGFLLLGFEARRSAQEGVVFLNIAADEENLPHVEREDLDDAIRVSEKVEDSDQEAYHAALLDDSPHGIRAHIRTDRLRSREGGK